MRIHRFGKIEQFLVMGYDPNVILPCTFRFQTVVIKTTQTTTSRHLSSRQKGSDTFMRESLSPLLRFLSCLFAENHYSTSFRFPRHVFCPLYHGVRPTNSSDTVWWSACTRPNRCRRITKRLLAKLAGEIFSDSSL